MSVAIGLAVVFAIIFYIVNNNSTGSDSGGSTTHDGNSPVKPGASNSASSKEESIEELKARIVKEAREAIAAGQSGEVKDLSALSLISLGTAAEYDELMNIIKTECDPRLRLVVCYLFLEQLSPNYTDETSSAGLLSFKFFSQELSPDEFALNFASSVDDFKEDPELYDIEFGPDAVWMISIKGIISRGCAAFPSRKEAGGLFARECAQIVEKIEDKELINRFSVVAEEVLKASGLMSSAAQGVLISMEL